MTCKCEDDIVRVDSLGPDGRNPYPKPLDYDVDSLSSAGRQEVPSGEVDNPAVAKVLTVIHTATAGEDSTTHTLDKTAGDIAKAFQEGVVVVKGDGEFAMITGVAIGESGYTITLMDGSTPVAYTAEAATAYPAYIEEEDDT